MDCRLCRSRASDFARATVLKRHTVCYFRCQNCGLIQTEEPYWLEDAYSQVIAASDVGVVSRTLELSQTSKVVIRLFFAADATFVDYGGGYGLFVRLMRDSGFDFYLYDKFCPNLFARGFEVKPNTGPYELVTALEVFEHLVKPIEEIEKMLSFSRNLLFTTMLVPTPPPKPEEWWYYSLDHGQHVSFYTRHSLSFIASAFGLAFVSNGHNLHLFCEEHVSEVLFRLATHPQSVRLLSRFFRRPSLTAKDYRQIIGKRLK